MERNFDYVAWDTALTAPRYTHQPAWTRVPTKPLCPETNLNRIMTRVSTLTQRCQQSSTSTSALSHQLPSWPGAFSFFQDRTAHPEDQDAPNKRARDDTFLSSDKIHQVHGQPDSKAQAVHDECRALVDVANVYMHRAEERLFPLYRSLRDGTYQAPVIGKRRRGMDHSDLQIQKNTFQTICDVMAPVLMARRDGLEEVTISSAAIAFQAYDTFPQNSRYPLVFYGIPALTNITERTEEPSPPRVRAPEPATISLDMRSDSDIFATAPIAQSPTPAPITRPPVAEALVAQSLAPEAAPIAQSPTFEAHIAQTTTDERLPHSPTSESTATPPGTSSDMPPAAICQLAEAAGHRLDGNANVVIEEGYNGKLFVRFKISADYATLFPRLKALDESSMVLGTPVCASTPHVLPQVTTPEPATHTPQVVIEAPVPAAESTTTTTSTLSELGSTPNIYEDDDSPNRAFMRDFIKRSKRMAENNTSPTRPALAPRSPNQGSPEKQAASPEKQPSPKSAASPSPPTTRRSSRLKKAAPPKSSIPKPIRIDSRSGAGRGVKPAAQDVTHVTRANTRKNKGKAQYPVEVLAAMGEGTLAAAEAPSAAMAPRGGKTVTWKSPVEEQPPKRVTRSRAKKIAAARA